MLLSQHPRTHYAKAPVHEVICQLRFPTILSINQADPAEFQDRIRAVLPQYVKREEHPAPKPGQNAETVNNYHFLSADGKWKLNLTRDFIALSTLAYPGWEAFARMLDKPLAEPDIAPEQVPTFTAEFSVKMDSSSTAKVKTGTGRLQARPGTPQDPEEKYILDLDLSMGGNLPCTFAAGALETLHGHAAPVFEGAVTDTLRRAMDPQ